jgi:ABC-2 type transport system ATP-binding protein
LINEMSLTAQRLVVIGRGNLIAETTVGDFTAQSTRQAVRVVTPMSRMFVAALQAVGATVAQDDDGAIVVTGMTSSEIGDLAAHRCLTVHELVPLRASLEDAFMELTHDSVEFRTSEGPRVLAAMASSGASPKEQS